MAEIKPATIKGWSQFRYLALERCTTEQLMWLAAQGRALFAEYANRNRPFPTWFEARYNAIDAALNKSP
jgi:hypothetical protein